MIRPSCGHGTVRLHKAVSTKSRSGIFFARWLDRKIEMPPVGQIRHVGWVQPFAKPINVATGNRWESLALRPCYELEQRPGDPARRRPHRFDAVCGQADLIRRAL